MASGSGFSADQIAHSRLTKVFRFLKELDELRNPVLRDTSSYPAVLKIDEWPVHPCIEIRRGDPISDEEPSESLDDADMLPLIRIKRAQLSQCPKPPPVLDSWLLSQTGTSFMQNRRCFLSKMCQTTRQEPFPGNLRTMKSVLRLLTNGKPGVRVGWKANVRQLQRVRFSSGFMPYG